MDELDLMTERRKRRNAYSEMLLQLKMLPKEYRGELWKRYSEYLEIQINSLNKIINAIPTR